MEGLPHCQLMSLGKLPLEWWSQDRILVQNMQVSIVTLIVATASHRHMDRVNGDTYPLMDTCTYHHQQREGDEEATVHKHE